MPLRNFVLPTNVDTLFLEGNASQGTGNCDAADALYGNAGITSTLLPGSGADFLVGTRAARTTMIGQSETALGCAAPRCWRGGHTSSGLRVRWVHMLGAVHHEWLGLTAREKIFGILNYVFKNKSQVIDIFAYDLNETDILQLLLKLAKQGRTRLIFHNSKDHHDKENTKPEDQFAKLFTKAAGSKQLLQRGMFKRYAHDKVIVVYKDKTRKTPLKVVISSRARSAKSLPVLAQSADVQVAEP
jgi:hypothetical protein